MLIIKISHIQGFLILLYHAVNFILSAFFMMIISPHNVRSVWKTYKTRKVEQVASLAAGVESIHQPTEIRLGHFFHDKSNEHVPNVY